MVQNRVQFSHKIDHIEKLVNEFNYDPEHNYIILKIKIKWIWNPPMAVSQLDPPLEVSYRKPRSGCYLLLVSNWLRSGGLVRWRGRFVLLSRDSFWPPVTLSPGLPSLSSFLSWTPSSPSLFRSLPPQRDFFSPLPPQAELFSPPPLQPSSSSTLASLSKSAPPARPSSSPYHVPPPPPSPDPAPVTADPVRVAADPAPPRTSAADPAPVALLTEAARDCCRRHGGRRAPPHPVHAATGMERRAVLSMFGPCRRLQGGLCLLRSPSLCDVGFLRSAPQDRERCVCAC